MSSNQNYQNQENYFDCITKYQHFINIGVQFFLFQIFYFVLLSSLGKASQKLVHLYTIHGSSMLLASDSNKQSLQMLNWLNPPQKLSLIWSSHCLLDKHWAWPPQFLCSHPQKVLVNNGPKLALLPTQPSQLWFYIDSTTCNSTPKVIIALSHSWISHDPWVHRSSYTATKSESQNFWLRTGLVLFSLSRKQNYISMQNQIMAFVYIWHKIFSGVKSSFKWIVLAMFSILW